MAQYELIDPFTHGYRYFCLVQGTLSGKILDFCLQSAVDWTKIMVSVYKWVNQLILGHFTNSTSIFQYLDYIIRNRDFGFFRDLKIQIIKN